MTDLYASSATGLRAQAVRAADDALARGRATLVIGLDNLKAFDDAVASATILALRRLRDAGGSVRLVTANDAHRQRLALTGLDRVFEIYPNACEAEYSLTPHHQGCEPSHVNH